MKSKTIFTKVGISLGAILLTIMLAGGVMAIAGSMAAAEAEKSVAAQAEAVTVNSLAPTGENVEENYIGEAEAKAVALAHAGLSEAEVSQMLCKLDYDDGVAEYEVEFWDGTTEYDYEINAVTGEIISYDYDMENYDVKPQPTPDTSSTATEYIGETKAKAVALAHAGLSESEVSQMLCKLDYDDGVAEYEVEFWDGTTEYDYEINAVTGEIISYDYDMENYDVKPQPTPDTSSTATEYIGEAKAKAVALAHAGLSESEVSHMKCEFDFDDGYAEYEVEWEVGTMEYEYTISAIDGTILEHDVEHDD